MKGGKTRVRSFPEAAAHVITESHASREGLSRFFLPHLRHSWLLFCFGKKKNIEEVFFLSRNGYYAR